MTVEPQTAADWLARYTNPPGPTAAPVIVEGDALERGSRWSSGHDNHE